MQPLRILVVEDEPVTRKLFVTFLTKEGHDLREADDLFTCRAALRLRPADLVLLDLGLPRADGLALAEELGGREDIGLFVVTSRGDVANKVKALDAGVDDYLVKPVDLAELAARIRTFGRRLAQRRGKRWRMGEWLLDLDRRSLAHSSGATVVLTRGELDLLGALADADGKIVSRETLSDAVSRKEHPTDVRSVDALVSRLRKKLSPVAGVAHSIATAPGFGYRLCLEVERL